MTLAWIQLLKSLVAGVGMYVFLRSVVKVSFAPAAIAAWCFPLSGFLVIWQGYSMTQTLVWYPWLLIAVDYTVR